MSVSPIHGSCNELGSEATRRGQFHTQKEETSERSDRDDAEG